MSSGLYDHTIASMKAKERDCLCLPYDLSVIRQYSGVLWLWYFFLQYTSTSYLYISFLYAACRKNDNCRSQIGNYRFSHIPDVVCLACKSHIHSVRTFIPIMV